MVDISNSSWSETDASNTAASPNGWPAGTFFNQVEPIGRATMGAIKRFWDRVNCPYTSAGSSGTYTITPTNTSYPSAYIQGETYSFKADKASAGNDVININSLGAINVYKATSSGIVQIAANDIQTGAHIVGQIDTALNGSAGGFLITGGLALGSGTVTNVTFTGDGTVLSGTPSSSVTTTGTLTANLNTQAANKIFAGPASGSPANPTFRSLVIADLPGFSPITNSLSGDVLLNNTSTYFDGPSVAQGTVGTWFVSGQVTVTSANNGDDFSVKLWDGTTVFNSTINQGPNNTGSNGFFTISLSGYIANPAGNIRLSVKDPTNTSGKIIFNQSGNSKDSTITAIRIL